jgi:RNA polymerase sigma-70 factor, ECF subfamily
VNVATGRSNALGDFAGAIGIRTQESAIVAELQAGAEEAYAWLIAEFSQPIYSLVYRILADSADAADTTQEVFLKVFRGINRFQGESSLKTWIYRIALHEASNRRRWWFRHKSRETSIEPNPAEGTPVSSKLEDYLIDRAESPFEVAAHEEVRARVEGELAQVAEPYRTTVILRDLEEMSYEEIAEIMQVSLGTVKSRLTRGRVALKERLKSYVRDAGWQLGRVTAEDTSAGPSSRGACREREFEVAS